MPDAPHLRVCLIPHDMQDGTAAPLNVEGPRAILMPAPCEVAPIVGVAFPCGGGLACAFGRGRCYQEVIHRPNLLRTSRGARQFGSPGGAPSRLTFHVARHIPADELFPTLPRDG